MGHCSTRRWATFDVTAGTARSRTSRVLAMAKMPSLSASILEVRRLSTRRRSSDLPHFLGEARPGQLGVLVLFMRVAEVADEKRDVVQAPAQPVEVHRGAADPAPGELGVPAGVLPGVAGAVAVAAADHHP